MVISDLELSKYSYTSLLSLTALPEVIHASVYYPPNSLKAKLCLKGNELMYAICKRAGIPHKNTGKLLVARSEEEVGWQEGAS